MPNRLDIFIQPDKHIKNVTNTAVNLHGFIMQSIPTEYAEKLHDNSLKPYSQYIIYNKEADAYQWCIKALDSEAEENILNKIITGVNGIIELRDKPLLCVKSKTLETAKSYKEFAELYYLKEKPRKRLKIEFMTPTAFKSEGHYNFIPTLELIFRSIVRKWQHFADTISLESDTLIEDIVKNTAITAYNLRSYKYNVDTGYINGFKGYIEINMRGPETLISLANLILYYGEYSGVGIKTALGMGGIKIE